MMHTYTHACTCAYMCIYTMSHCFRPYTHIHTHTYMCTPNIHVYATYLALSTAGDTCIHGDMYTWMYIHVHTCTCIIHPTMHAHKSRYIVTGMHAHTHSCIHSYSLRCSTCTHTYVRGCMHTCVHTHLPFSVFQGCG